MRVTHILAPVLATTIAAISHAAIVDFTDSAVVTNAVDVEATSADGVVATVYGYQAEFTTPTTANVYGPFPTTPGSGGNPIYGVDTRGQRNPGIGLLAQPTGGLAPSENDRGTALFQPGFDNTPRSGSFPEVQFAVLTFSEPVDVSQVITDGAGFIASIWVAGGVGPLPDLTTDFLGTLTSLGVQTSLDDRSGRVFIHHLTPLVDVDYLLVGTLARDADFGPLPQAGPVQFFLDGLGLAPTGLPLCADGLDNDEDGFTDHPSDPGCASSTSEREAPQCQDGLNNDGRYGIDFDGGQSIHGPCQFGTCPPGVHDQNGDGVPEPDPQCESFADNREAVTYTCGLGPELALLLPVLLAWRQRRRWMAR